MESRNLPSILEALSANINNKNISTCRIKINIPNIFIFTSILSIMAPIVGVSLFLSTVTTFVFLGFVGSLILAAGIISSSYALIRTVKTIQKHYIKIEFDNGEKKSISTTAKTLPLLHTAMKNNNLISYTTEKDNEDKIDDYIIFPKESENNLDKYINTLVNNDKIFFNNNGIWTIRYNKDFIQLKDFKGPNYIQQLLISKYKKLSYTKLFYSLGENTGETNDTMQDKGILESDTSIIKEHHNLQYDRSRYRHGVKTDEEELLTEKRILKKGLIIIEEDLENSHKMNYEEIEDLEDKRYYILSRIKQINMYFKKGSTKKDFNKDEERIRQALAQATKKFYKTINTENTCTLYKHIKNSIKVQNGYIYAPENNIDWVFSTE